MITTKDVMHIGFLKKLPFKGSFCGMRFMLRAVKGEEGSITALEAFHWPEPFCFEKTPPETLVRKEFSFTEDGISQAVEWLNIQHELPEHRALWTVRLLP